VEGKETATGTPPIGSAIDGVSVHILDESMREVSSGNAGEIYVGGANLARGYRNQPALTAEKFVHHPSTGERLYRTGDLGRRLPHGEIEFLGRMDDQIKIRGYRIEPLEIINALNLQPDVQSSVVMAREDQPGEKRLVAYVVARGDSVLRAADLRRHLGTLLPDYMVPAVFVKVDGIPTTANGKADRAAMPRPDETNILRDHEYVEPSTMVEQKLAEIAAPLLKVDKIGKNDNFFLLGGHSLLGTQLLTKIQEAFGVELSLLSLFDHPTIEAMAGEIEKLILAKLDAEESTPAVPDFKEAS
jgi:acyl carrier protein